MTTSGCDSSSREGLHVLAVAAAEDAVFVLEQHHVDVEPAEEPRGPHVVAPDALRDRREHTGPLGARLLVDDHHPLDAVDACNPLQAGVNVGGERADAADPRWIGGNDRGTQSGAPPRRPPRTLSGNGGDERHPTTRPVRTGSAQRRSAGTASASRTGGPPSRRRGPAQTTSSAGQPTHVNSPGVGTNSPASMRAIAAESSASSAGTSVARERRRDDGVGALEERVDHLDLLVARPEARERVDEPLER